jgi:nucleotide-binding universal stress UspA family protein
MSNEKKEKRVKGFKRILFPTDLTTPSEYVFSYVVSLVRRYRAKLYVVHVVDTAHEAAGFYVPHPSFEKLHGEMREGAGGALKKFCSRRLKDIKDCEMAVLEGEPHREIAKFIDEKNIDLVVMATFGRGRVDRFIFGSTTERVMRKARCPVLVIPPPI